MSRTFAVSAAILAGVIVVALMFGFFDNEYPGEARLPGAKVKIEKSQSPDFQTKTGSVHTGRGERDTTTTPNNEIRTSNSGPAMAD